VKVVAQTETKQFGFLAEFPKPNPKQKFGFGLN
jgi:hypothetical protein